MGSTVLEKSTGGSPYRGKLNAHNVKTDQKDMLPNAFLKNPFNSKDFIITIALPYKKVF